ncbi:hypothetical protein AURDEDRAFT_124933 [Auricularia subglabra TFB-10046 SS5]|nr:hypothetical protein AURDEDRAFT_124933 [Auricularia subglabra TFB-10046 SS5]
MHISQAISCAAYLLGGVDANNVRLIEETINARVAMLGGVLADEAAAANGDPREPPVIAPADEIPPKDIDVHTAHALANAIHGTVHERTLGFESLPTAGRIPRVSRVLADLRRSVSMAIAELLAAQNGCSSPETRACIPRNVPRARGRPPVSFPVAGDEKPPPPCAVVGLPTPRQTPYAGPSALPRSGPSPQALSTERTPASLRRLPAHIVTQIIENLDSLDDIDSLVTALPTAAIARLRVRRIAPVARDNAAATVPPIPLSPRQIFSRLPRLRVLRIDGLLQRDPDDQYHPPFALQQVALIQGHWIDDDVRYAIDALGLVLARTVRLENANVDAMALLPTRAKAVTGLRLLFNGRTVHVDLATAAGLSRSFTGLDGVALPAILQAVITRHLTHITLSNWLPLNWIQMLFEYAPTSLVTFELVLGSRPVFDQYCGWAGCDALRTLRLSADTETVEIDEGDVLAFMTSAFTRRVAVECRDVTYMSTASSNFSESTSCKRML